MVRTHIRIRGQVQGVGFRWSTVEESRRLRLTGWVRNTLDGGVEIVAEGERDRVDLFLEWCHSGPPSAEVDGVRDEESAATGEFEGFDVRS